MVRIPKWYITRAYYLKELNTPPKPFPEPSHTPGSNDVTASSWEQSRDWTVKSQYGFLMSSAPQCSEVPKDRIFILSVQHYHLKAICNHEPN